uniref:Uncharacterized protein n=1 Tax=Avena sativa TaxID=4498 RepID=A0ACD5ZU45_AVESA
MSTPATISGSMDQSTAGTPSQLAISNGVLLAAVIFLFMVVVFVFLLYLYAKRFLGTNPMLHGPSTPSSRFLFIGDSPFPGRGLPPSVLRSLPVAVFAGANTPGGGSTAKADALECAVCLSEVADGEKVRSLPKCGHRFHLECIDMWFHSHDTCPLCRAPVGASDAHAATEGLPRVPREDPAAPEFPLFPTNVLFWGTHDHDVANAGLVMPPRAPTASASSMASERRNGSLVIDIPARAMPSLTTSSSASPLPPSRMPGGADDLRSPLSARLRSLRRLLSRGKQAVSGTSSSSPRGMGGDVEQGLAARPPKTPKTPPSSN